MEASAEQIVAALRGGRPVVVTVASGSMSPTLATGDRVVVRAGSPEVGDVVLIRGAGPPILHRLIAVLRVGPLGRCVHTGDAAGARAGLCRAEDLLGVAELPRRRPTRGAQLHHLLSVLLGRITRAPRDP